MKLYYSPGSCSTSCHITLEESGLKYELAKVTWDNPSDANLLEMAKLNPLGTVPILITDEGKQLDQNISIHSYVADLAPEKKLLPSTGSFERYFAMNLLSFVASDLHKAIGGLFSIPAMSKEKLVQGSVREFMKAKSNDYLRYMNDLLAGKDYLMGSQFTVADSYAFVVTGWTRHVDIALSPYKNVEAYMARVASRPAVAKALKDEGLI